MAEQIEKLQLVHQGTKEKTKTTRRPMAAFDTKLNQGRDVGN